MHTTHDYSVPLSENFRLDSLHDFHIGLGVISVGLTSACLSYSVRNHLLCCSGQLIILKAVEHEEHIASCPGS